LEERNNAKENENLNLQARLEKTVRENDEALNSEKNKFLELRKSHEVIHQKETNFRVKQSKWKMH
jgi:hypothetical protein